MIHVRPVERSARNRAAGPDDGPLHEKCYQEVRRALMAGRFTPGQIITLRGLASALGTSPMPVREALRRLVAERALTVGPHRSVVVPIVTRAKYAEICDVRIALEGLAAEQAALRIAEPEIERLASLCEQVTAAVDARDVRTYLAKNQELHLAVYEAAASELLLHIIETLWVQVGPTLNYLFHDLGFALRAASTNTPIVDALRAHDGSAARAAVAADIAHAAAYLLEQLPEAHDAALVLSGHG